jgi:hypothetical protein
VKRFFYSRMSFTVAAIAIFLVGMLRDPDMANADDLNSGPVVHERLPGYQAVPDPSQASPLTQAEIAKLNASSEDPVPTF